MIIFHQITSQNNGRLPLSVGTGEPVNPIYSQGLLLNADGEIYATLSAPSSFQAGLGFHESRLCVEEAAPVTFSGGLGFTASGALAASSGAASGYDQGVQTGTGGALCVNGLTPPPPAPGAVTNLAAAPRIEGVLVSWDGIVGVTNYTVYYRLVGAPSWTTVANGVATEREINGLTPGSSYEVTVTATNGGGTGPQATPETATPLSNLSNVFYWPSNTGYRAFRMDTTPWLQIPLLPASMDTWGHFYSVFLPDKMLLAVAGDTAPYLRIFDISATPAVEITAFTPPTSALSGPLAATPDGEHILVSTNNLSASRIYTVEDWSHIEVGALDFTGECAASADGTMAFFIESSTVKGFLMDGTALPALPSLPAVPGNITAHPTENKLFVQEQNSTAAPILYDLNTWTSLGSPPTSGTGQTMRYSPDGAKFVQQRRTSLLREYAATPSNNPASWTPVIATDPPAGPGASGPLRYSRPNGLYLATRATTPSDLKIYQPGVSPLTYSTLINVGSTLSDNVWSGGNTQAEFLNFRPFTGSPPALAPTSPAAAAGAPLTIDVSWAPVVGATGYLIVWGTGGIFGGQTRVTNGAANSITLPATNTALSYNYAITAFNDNGIGPFSDVVTATPNP